MYINYNELIKNAKKAKDYAYAPYSHFSVGAALLTKSGKVYKGCNIENAAYTPSNCAERTAFYKAVSEGESEFVAIAIVASDTKGEDVKAFPCGVCRQVMREFCSDDFIIVVAKSTTDFDLYTLDEILPYGFGPKDLD